MGQHNTPKLNILRDVVIRLTGQQTGQWYPQTLGLIEAIVEVDNKPQRMIFITNNFDWAANSICDLYKARWSIEVFFKEIKQTLQLSDFMGYNENAAPWQIWMALLAYVLLRFVAWQNEWKHTFTRLFTALRGVVWCSLDLGSVLKCCGTATDPVRMRAAPDQAYLPGFAPILPTSNERKNRKWVSSKNKQCKLKHGGQNDEFKKLWDGSVPQQYISEK